MSRENRMFGLWPSPVSSSALAAGLRLGEPCWDTDGRTLGWIEGRSDRGVIVVQDVAGGATRDLTGDIPVRAFVGYGGGDFTLSHGAAYFVGQADQRIYRQELAGGSARPITPAFGAASTPRVSPDGRWVAYVHTYEDVDTIAIVDSQGEHWPTRLGQGRDFYMQPAWHPSGEQLAWIEWNHPNMPWDGTQLHLAEVAGNGQLEDTVIAGAQDISIMQPEWVDEDRIAYVSDESGWWNPYIHQVSSARATRLVDRAAEFAGPLWQVGSAWYVLEDQRTLLCSYGTGTTKLARVHALTGGLEDLPLPFTRVRPLQVRDGWLLAGTSSMTQGEQITLVNLDTLEHRAVAGSIARLPDPAMLPQVEEFECTNVAGQSVHALLYRPRQDGLTGLDDELPPYVTFVHGGPTAQAAATLNATIAYYTSRGIGVVDVNYGGSTGYGRDYRNRLRGQWGVVDVADTVSVIKALVARGIADPARVGIEGGSAGGWTVLSALTNSEVFRAGISRYGVSDLVALMQDTHDFESQYMFSLVGPYPEAADLYEKRAPINHVSKISCPVLLLQGDEDLVVPPSQSQVVADALAARGIPHAYILFAGEQHGFRQSENIVSALESSLAFYAQIFGFETDAPAIELS